MSHWEVWESWGVDPWVIQVFRFRYQVPFRSRPPLSRVLLPLLSHSPMSIKGLALAAAVVVVQEKEAIEPAPPSLGYYSRLFVTPKGHRWVASGYRPQAPQQLSDVSHFHMETTQSVLQSLCPGNWMISLDLQGAYLQVPVHSSSRRYLRFCMGESIFQFRALCFGLSTAPQAFTRARSLRSCIATGSGSSGTSTTGLFLVPPFARLSRRGIFWFDSVNNAGFRSTFPRAP